MKKISIYNNKGGVAKTTSVINIAYSLHKADKKVLVVDCDTQKNCINFLFSEELKDKIFSTNYNNINVMTYNDYRHIADEALSNYDYVLFDLPPTFSDEVREIINLSDKVYVPIMPRMFELSGLKNITSCCGSKLGGIFVTMYEKDDEPIVEKLKTMLGSTFISTVIPYSKTVKKSQREKIAIEEYFCKYVPKVFASAWGIVKAYDAITNVIVGGTK